MAFIGLMIPHIVRALVGTDYRYIIPSSAIVGGIFMLFADTLGRTINAPYETPVAAIVAAVGLPFFLIIIRKGGKMSHDSSSIVKKQRIILCILLVLIIMTIVLGMGIGDASLSYDRLLPTLFGKGSFTEEFVLFSIRLPKDYYYFFGRNCTRPIRSHFTRNYPQ